MDRKRLITLLEKYHAGRCTNEEIGLLKGYFKSENLSEFENLLVQEWLNVQSKTLSTDESQKLWQQLHRETLAKRQTKRTFSWRIVAAAAVTLLLGLMLWYSNTGGSKDDHELMVASTNSTRHPILLDLSDGSKVWLSQGAQIRYQKTFSATSRQLELIGRAYFDIAKDSLRPFVIQANNTQVEVLGTAFDLQALEEDSLVTLALIEGEVKMMTSGGNGAPHRADTIQAGQQITYNENQHKTTVALVDEPSQYDWKVGVIYFDGANIREVRSTLQRWYDLEIIIPPSLISNSQLVYRFDTNEIELSEVLSSISQVTDYHFINQKDNHYEVRMD